jgi:amidohydrolase
MVARISAVLLLLLLRPAGLYAQSTETERQASLSVVARIESLQTELRPQALAAKLSASNAGAKAKLMARVEQLWRDELGALSDHIGRHPEVGFQEHATVDTLVKVLRHHGFRVELGQAKLETAFVGTWESPAGTNGPTLGIIVEYDALRGTREPFHGCQHNAQSPVGFAAAIALAEHMTSNRVAGRIVVYGTPAEEMGPPSKVTMWKAGVFRGADILIRSHGAGETSRSRAGFGVCCLNINMVRYVYEGRPAHQRASWNGRNALTAAVQLYTAVDHLRPSLRPEAVIQGVMPEGGVAPNVVPDRAVVDYYIRYPDEVYLAHIDSMMTNAARAAALATGTKVTIERYGEYRDGVTLGTLEELVFAYAKQLAAPALNETPGRPDGYEETGFVTREIPGVGINVFSSPAPGHSYERWEDSLKPVGHTGFLLDARIMANVLHDFLTDASFRATVKREHEVMAGLFNQYLDALKQAYAPEIGSAPTK